MIDIVLLGAGGHAKSCIEVIEKSKEFKILGLVDNNKNKEDNFLNYKILGTDKDLSEINKYCKHAFVTVGQILDYEKKYNLFNLLIENNFIIPKILSPHSVLAKNAVINKGTIVMHNVVVNASVTIGDNCIINTGSIIEHDVTIGSNTHIAPGAIINGNVVIGDNSFIGSGSIIKQGIKIGKNCLINAGVKIFSDVPDSQVIK